MPTASLDLPFAVPAKETGKAFTPSMETTSILLLAEAKRRRRGLLGTKTAKISFLSKLHYPLWAVPWEPQSLITDGLATSQSIIVVQRLPDIITFIEDIERGASVRELFRSAIEKHMRTFNDFTERVNVQADALIADKDLLLALSEYVQEASAAKVDNSPIVLAPPKLDVTAAVETTRQMQSLHKQMQSEIASLEYARTLLEETTKLHEQMISKEVNSVREVYDAQIAELRPAVEKKMDQLLRERDARTARMKRIAENALKTKEREREKRERELQRLELAKADLVRRREARKRRRDKIGEANWEHRIRANEKRVDEVKARIRAVAEFIDKTRRQNEADTEKMVQGYQWLIDQERQKITSLESQRDESVGTKHREVEALKLAVNQILRQIEELVSRKKDEAAELKTLTITRQFDEATLLCLPFYLVCYQTENAPQFHVFSPVRVTDSEGVVEAIRRKLVGLRNVSKLALFLQPRSKALGDMLDFAIKEKMTLDKAFSRDISEAAVASNILVKDNLKETLTQGIAELKDEGWITQKDEAIVKAYV